MQEELEHESPRSSRGSFLTAAGLGAAALAGRPATAAASGVPQVNAGRPFSWLAECVSGVIEEMTAPSTLRLRRDGGVLHIQLSADAAIWREGLATMEDFSVGDEVVAEGRWLDRDRFEASALIDMYRLVEGTVLSREDGTLLTSRGTIRLVASTRVQHGAGLAATSSTDYQIGQGFECLEGSTSRAGT